MKNNYIIGTAGHIDHGKTTLIKALTGNETDKLKEEKERGISINLGFTALDLSNGERAGIIDVPGHENFIKNMMAGVVGIDIILLVIAADDGVMPQTIEHAQILHYMGVDNAIIVISKKNMVTEDVLDLVKADIEMSFKDTILEDAPIIAVDSVSGENIDQLKTLIEEKILTTEKKEDSKSMRMNIDRSFTLKGIGTIITGTLTEGEIYKDHEYMLYPSGKKVKVRSIENHDVPIEVAHKGQRIALNLSNISSNEIERGDIIAQNDSLIRVKNVQTKLSLSKFDDIEIEHWTRVRFFHGTKEVLARAVPLDQKEIKANQTALCEFRLEENIFVKRGDKFVIRSYSPVKTIGGGEIIDTNSQNHTVNSTDYVSYLKNKEEFTEIDEIIDFLDTFKTEEEIYTHMGIEKSALEEDLKQMVASNDIQILGESYIASQSLEKIATDISQIVKDYHKENPLDEGISKEELRQKLDLNLDGKDFEAMLKNKILTKHIMLQKGYVKDKNFAISLAKDQNRINELIEQIKANEPKLSKESDVFYEKDKDLLAFLLKNDLVKIDEFVIRNEYYTKLVDTVKEYFKDNDKLEAKEFRDISGLSRNQAIVILEYLDRKNITKRVDDYRILL
ncbi:selenocysteine-specific translation elongation factor [Anaerococcus sp.]|uniref:selenocysteine-specific translation elongation factor n=1 Tax=Anaerococcus sp. TaxID=1872515 RepID=UPI00280A97E6|nr:selenocysteine-specific translation elongation factor [Anaerococcus sp.]MDU2599407.1 selenocysteine-specific translation elongation factor [Anaerococcus sp.]MDU3176394.1 selenocysteine-specific translation elongation factor [Anaerococcus sp.]